MTKEHVVPSWLWRLYQTIYETDEVSLSVDGRTVRSLRTTRYAVAYRKVCAECNNVWSSRLESGFRDLAIPAITGEAPIAGKQLRWNVAAQTLAATWAVKFWLLLSVTQRHLLGHAVVSPDTLHYLYEHGAPPSGMRVYLATANLTRTTAIGYWSTRLEDSTTGMNGMMSLINLRCLGFCLMAPETVAGAQETGIVAGIGPVLKPWFEQIWPIEQPEVGWPTAGVLDERLIKHLFPGTIRFDQHEARPVATSPPS